MHTLTRLAPMFALLASTALVACDKGDDHDNDIAASASTGGTEAESTGDAGSATEAEGATEVGGDDTTGGTTEAGEQSATEAGSHSGTGDTATEGTTDTTGEEVVCDDAHFGASRPCEGGTQFCAFLGVEGVAGWGVCVAEPACTEFEWDDCAGCYLNVQGVPYLFDECDLPEDDESTPLVLSFDGAAIEYGSGGHRFDLGRCEATDWPTASTPWLALDRDRSGQIDGGHELFGSATRLRGGGLADNGFTALAELDLDRDGKITPADPAFAELVLWADGDADRRSSGLELQSVGALGLVEIELRYASDRRCDARANCEVERASFTWRDALGREQVGEVVDVHLACQ
jgi:hypothetical protein